jgi:hypothetical protein
MLTLTEGAVRVLEDVLDRDEVGDRAVRIVAGRNGWFLRLDCEDPDDYTFEHEGRTILLLAPSVAAVLEEKTLDVQGTEESRALRLE